MVKAPWRVLPPRSAAHIPTLLLKHEISLTTYTVYLTDMTHIWTESLDRRKIIQRAFAEDSCIDPSEGVDQLRYLLDAIHSALSGEDGTNLSLYSCAGDEKSRLQLRLSSPLPEPLLPLHWSIQLSLASQNLLTKELVFPYFAALSASICEASSLISLLKEKDHVITRLTAQLQAVGIDLVTVFPSAASSKLSMLNSWDILAPTVKGLAGFEEETWRASGSWFRPSTLEELCRNVFENSAKQSEHRLPDIPGEWWNEFSSGHHSYVVPSMTSDSKSMRIVEPSPKVHHTPRTSDQNMGHPMQGDDILKFQDVRPDSDIPPAQDISESTASETDDDLDNIVSKNTPEIKAFPSKVVKRIGFVGGRRIVENSSPSADSAPAPRYSDTHEIVDALTPEAQAIIQKSNKSLDSIRGKLGRICGKRSDNGYGEHVTALESDANGMAASVSTSLERAGRIKEKPSQLVSPPRESSQDRADRKRTELKHKLDSKRNVPIKKKRKF